jgi:hypothetical protein
LVEQVLMSSDGLEGLTVRACDGQTLDVVVGVFAEGPLADRLRVQGANDLGRYPAGPQHGVAVVPAACRLAAC